jgi:hypothetical protein
MKAERLFLYTMKDLEACHASPWQYHRNRMSILLRLLLLEGLMHRVNAELKLKPKFLIGFWLDEDGTIAGVRPSDPALPVSPELRLAPGIARVPGRIEVVPVRRTVDTLDEFLALHVMAIESSRYSVRDVIVHMATFNGPAHAHRPKTDADKALFNARVSMRRSGAPAGGNTLRSIGIITIRALKPLFDHHFAKLPAFNQSEMAIRWRYDWHDPNVPIPMPPD